MLQICVAGPDCTQYDQDPAVRSVQAAQGTVAYATCSSKLYFPLSYLVMLDRTTRAGQSDFTSFEEAFDYWFLVQLMNGVGKHSRG